MRPYPTRGNRVIRWIERNCVYGEGDWFGQPVRMEEFQRRWVRRLYQYHPDTGRRVYRRALWGLGKGNGKTPMEAWIAAYELFRDDVVSPRVIIGAASLKQADLVFGDLRATVTESPHLSPFASAYDLEIQLRDRPGKAERIAAAVGTNDGARATAFLADELHEWTGRNARVYIVVDGAVAKRRDAFTMAASTAGYDQETLLHDLYAHGVRVAQGVDDDPTFLFEWYEPHDDTVDWDDPAAYERAMRQANPAYGIFNDPAAIRHRFETMPRHEFRRYHANQWTESQEVWIDAAQWDACDGAAVIPDGSEVVLGVDVGLKHDSTAVVIARMDADGVIHATWKVWNPEDEDDQVLDLRLVEDYVRDAMTRYRVIDVAYDPWYFERSRQTLEDEGVPMLEFRQTADRMGPASEALFDLVVSGNLRHGGDPVARRHALSAAVKQTERGWRISKQQSGKKIDALVALAMAVHRLKVADDPGAPWVMVV